MTLEPRQQAFVEHLLAGVGPPIASQRAGYPSSRSALAEPAVIQRLRDALVDDDPTYDEARDAGLLRALEDDPEHTDALAIYADWLVERAHPLGAALIACLAEPELRLIWVQPVPLWDGRERLAPIFHYAPLDTGSPRDAELVLLPPHGAPRRRIGRASLIDVAPFLLATRPLTERQRAALLGQDPIGPPARPMRATSDADRDALLARADVRLPTRDELTYARRAGEPGSWSVDEPDIGASPLGLTRGREGCELARDETGATIRIGAGGRLIAHDTREPTRLRPARDPGGERVLR